jgi:predicted amidohydrolase YtcJ
MRLNLPKILLIILITAIQGTVYAQRILSSSPEAIFYNGKIITIDTQETVSEAFAIRDGRFMAVGSSTDVQALAAADTDMYDLEGNTVIPGLMDNHNHQYHVALLTFRGVDLQGIQSLAEMLERISGGVSQAGTGDTIYTNMSWSAADLLERRGPNLAELDEIAPDNPVVVYATRSRLHLNTAALEALQVSAETDIPQMLIVDRDDSGSPTGLIGGIPASVMMFAAQIVPQPSMDEMKTLIIKMQAEQHAMGLTGIRDLQLFPEVMRAYYELWREGKLTMRVSMGLELNAGEEYKMEGMLTPWGIASGFGDEWLRIDGVAEYNAGDKLREPYHRGDGTDVGAFRASEKVYIDSIRYMNQYGWRPSVHVTGDATLDLVLDAYEAANEDRSIHDRRWIVEHIPLVHDDQIQRMKRLGVIVSAQFQPYGRARSMVSNWGQERTERALPMRDLLDAGIVVSGGSDWPGAPNNPFINIYYYVSRDTLQLGPIGLDQRISRQEAIRIMSLNNAYMTYEEDIKGSIEPGKLADFVILSEDILSVPEAQIRDIRPHATYVAGKKVYKQE